VSAPTATPPKPERDPRRRASSAQRERDAALLQRLQDREPAAFEELVRDQAGRMLAVARRLMKSEDEAEDAVQEAFVSAFKAIDAFKGDSLLSTWLHRIVVNASLMRLRAKQRRPETSIEEMLPRFQEDGVFQDMPVPWRTTSEGLIHQEQVRRLVREQIDRLPETYRTVLLLRDIEELDTAETAEVLQITPNAVKIRLHRARLALRQLLDEHLREEAG